MFVACVRLIFTVAVVVSVSYIQVREARLAAQAAADAFDPEALAEVELQPPPRRALVVYDDL